MPSILNTPPETPLEKLRRLHHLKARCVAGARSIDDNVAGRAGCSVEELTKLMHDQAFQQLVAYYRKQFKLQQNILDGV